MSKIGIELKRLREKNNLSFKRVSKLTNVSDSTLHRIEHGMQVAPPAKVLKRLSSLYKQDIISLYLTCGYLEKSDLENYQQIFSNADKLTVEEKNQIQLLINLLLKNRKENINEI